MMNLNDFQNAINDYLENSGQNPKDWNVHQAAIDLRDLCSEAESIDDVPSGVFVEVLEENEF